MTHEFSASSAAAKRFPAHHQRSSSTGSHGIMFGSSAPSFGPPPTSAHLNLQHHLNHQSSGSPDFLSDDEEEISNWDLNGSGANSHGAPEIQGKSKLVETS